MAALSSGMLFQILLDAGARQIVRIQIVAGRHGRSAGERMVLVDQIPTAAHDHEQRLELVFGVVL